MSILYLFDTIKLYCTAGYIVHRIPMGMVHICGNLRHGASGPSTPSPPYYPLPESNWLYLADVCCAYFYIHLRRIITPYNIVWRYAQLRLSIIYPVTLYYSIQIFGSSVNHVMLCLSCDSHFLLFELSDISISRYLNSFFYIREVVSFCRHQMHKQEELEPVAKLLKLMTRYSQVTTTS